jgi:hypothetical protein
MSDDAYRILASELAAFRELTYDELAPFIGEPLLRRVRGADSTEYAIEITFRWRDIEGGDIRVVGWAAVDDCGPMRRADSTFVVSRI